MDAAEKDNPWVEDLLKWHSHEMGGVRHPFDERTGNPILDADGHKVRIETWAVRHVCEWADAIGRESADVRWVFLVGGPGNGKSECVQAFCEELDSALACDGGLTAVLTTRFGERPLPDDEIMVNPEDLPEGSRVNFAAKVGLLVLIQDASAARSPHEDPARVLLRLLESQVAQHRHPQSVLLCCANRGLLARVLRYARQKEHGESVVTRLISGVLVASGLGTASLGRDPEACWPLKWQDEASDGITAACWPLDLESLLTDSLGQVTCGSPGVRILREAVSPRRWQESQECQSCSGRQFCPFRQNALWLHDEENETHLQAVLRYAELGMGKRWSFRDLLTLAPELIVGEWEDFAGQRPCAWVREQVGRISATDVVVRAEACHQLMTHLYPHVLFPKDWLSEEGLRLCGDAATNHMTGAILGPLHALTRQRGICQSTYMRSLLREQLTPLLDPYLDSPHEGADVMSKLEDAFSQSVDLGQECWRKLEKPGASAGQVGDAGLARPSAVEEAWSGLLQNAESELAANTQVSDVVLRSMRCMLRQMACMTAKRSVGIRTGHCAQSKDFALYTTTIRDKNQLVKLRDVLLRRMGPDGFEFDALETLGQPRSTGSTQTLLKSSRLGCVAQPAPLSCWARPGHDLPSLVLNKTSIPVTFEFFRTLNLLQLGCEAGTLPSSVRGLLDRAKQMHAGSVCREDKLFENGATTYEAGRSGYSIGVDEHGKSYVKAPVAGGGR